VQLNSDVSWFNVTFLDHSYVFSLVRQLELSLLQLTLQVDELSVALQSTLLGKLPLAIVKPNVLHDILKNGSLQLDPNFELIAGIKIENIHLYYELIKVSVMGNAHNITLILEIPLKSVSQIFTLYRIIALPTTVLDNTFATYRLDYDYFGLSYTQRDYLLLTESDMQKCNAGIITICPASKVVLSVHTLTCESQLYFQKAVKHGTCRRSVLVNYDTPTLQRHEDTWIYNLPN
jgi:hypothetical protein